MPELPRLAVGTIQPEADIQPILWSLMESLRRDGLQIQSFMSRACFTKCAETATVTGLHPRHLDSWLMSREMCREVFVHGTQTADLAVVQGCFDPAPDSPDVGGKLGTLCQWLDLPRLVVLDAAQLDGGGLPKRPDRADGNGADGLLLDRVNDEKHLAQLSAELEANWGVPVLGALETLPRLREAVDAVPRGSRLPEDLGRQLADQFTRHWKRQPIYDTTLGRERLETDHCLFRADSKGGKLTVAVAYDEVFNCYFPDVLDMLEICGAEVVDFSPLRDEVLPPDTDLVYIGCGHPERYLTELSENHCMKAALRDHLRQGRRVYGEGGGLAYLCEQLITVDGLCGRMAGIFPALAWLSPSNVPPKPVEVTLEKASWLGEAGTRLRGYRNPNWHLEAAGPLLGISREDDQPYDLVASGQAIGSQLHFDFAVQAESFRHFFHPNSCSDKAPALWTSAP